MAQSDAVLIEGLQVRARLGVPAAERRRRQRVLLDLALETDLKQAGAKDAVERTIDYAAVCRRVRTYAEGRAFRLAEALAEGTAAEVLKCFRPRAVRVRVRKFSVPGAAAVGVQIIRRRPASKRGQALFGRRFAK